MKILNILGMSIAMLSGICILCRSVLDIRNKIRDIKETLSALNFDDMFDDFVCDDEKE